MLTKRIRTAGLIVAILAAATGFCEPPAGDDGAGAERPKAPAPLTDEEQEALRKAIRRLASEAPEERDAAALELAGAGTRALAFLRAERDAGGASDVEAGTKLREIVAELEKEARIGELVAPAEVRAVADWIGTRSCPQCGGPGWTARLNGALEKIAPRCRALEFRWSCHPDAAPEFVVVCRKPDAVLVIANISSFKRMGSWLEKVKTAEEAEAAARAMLALSPQISGEAPEENPEIKVTGDAGKGWTCQTRKDSYRIEIRFRADGSFAGIVIYGGGGR